MGSPLRIRLAPELSLSAVTYGKQTDFPVLCVHGWMDNAATMQAVGPALSAAGLFAIALDLPGHGLSDHRPPSSHYLAVEYAANIVEAATALGFERFAVCGHSLGSGLSTLVAGGVPERCVGLICIEGLGPSTRPHADAPTLFARGVASKAAGLKRDGSLYTTIDDAVEQRLATVARYEGNQTLSRHAAEALVSRALVECEIDLPACVAHGAPAPQRDASAGAATSAASAEPAVRVKRWRFRHDRRIIGPSLVTMAEEQVCAFLASVGCPALVVTATHGWPRDAAVYTRRLSVLQDGACPGVTHATLPGGHHLHLDPATAPAVCSAIQAWAATVLLPAVANVPPAV